VVFWCIIVTLCCICLYVLFVVLLVSVSFFFFLSSSFTLVEFVSLVAKLEKEKNYGIEMNETKRSETQEIRKLSLLRAKKKEDLSTR